MSPNFKLFKTTRSEPPLVLRLENTSQNSEADTSVRSCFEVAKMCLSDSVCNRKLAPQLADCSTRVKHACNRPQCQASIRSFYEQMPFNVAQLFAFCECHHSDSPCQDAKKAIHSEPCAHLDLQTKLDFEKEYVLHFTEKLQLVARLWYLSSPILQHTVRERYETFKSKCWGRVSICHGDENCFFEVDKGHHSCTADDECRAAYIKTLGTILQEQCTCSDVTASKEARCQYFHHILQRKSCFGNISDFNTSHGSMDANVVDFFVYGTKNIYGTKLHGVNCAGS
ncbi:GDNF family receptor alpha-like [Ambystoma mexicanum]|uniref:GDNF family receptor alpha-like n=1 Tax=Ambystoma mexicanum TaxID=8296 RepID=UPI0037E8CCAD